MSNTASTQTQQAAKEFRVYWTNHGYFSSEEFSTVEEAVVYANSKCFDATIYHGESLVGSVTVFGGYRRIR